MKYLLTAMALFSLSAQGQSATSTIYLLPDSAKERVTISNSLFFCKHIYVAVIPDTVIWDKTPRSPFLGLSLSSSGTISMDSKYVDPKPNAVKIVCLLCHNLTEQTIKEIEIRDTIKKDTIVSYTTKPKNK